MNRSASDKPAPPRERGPLAEMLAIAGPVVAAMTSYTLMQFVDKLMVSRIGPDPIYVGAQGNGGLAAFVPIAIAMGLVTVVNTYVSQNLGAGSPERAPAYAWAGLWMCAAYWLVLLVPYGFVLPHVLDALRNTDLPPPLLAEAVRRDAMAAEYGRILIFGSIITMSTRAISQYFYGMHRPVVVLAATVTGNVVHFILNSFFIYGPVAPAGTGVGPLDAWFDFTAGLSRAWGLGAHGVPGSGVSTVLSTAVELAIPLGVFLSPRYNRLYGTVRAWRPSAAHIRDIARIGWPGAVMFGNEMVCWGFFMVGLVGKFGNIASTAGWIAHQWMTLSFMPTVGISIAVTAMVGRCMGMGRPDLAVRRAWLGLSVAVAYMGVCGVCFVVFRRGLSALFIDPNTAAGDAEQLIRLGSSFLIATAAFQLFDGVAMSLSGALRGAGDTRWPGIITLVLSWTVIVGGGLAIVRWAPGLGPLGPWIAAAAYICLLSIAILWRFVGGAWKRIKLLERSDVAAIPVAL